MASSRSTKLLLKISGFGCALTAGLVRNDTMMTNVKALEAMAPRNKYSSAL